LLRPEQNQIRAASTDAIPRRHPADEFLSAPDWSPRMDGKPQNLGSRPQQPGAGFGKDHARRQFVVE
jgi:hypothetical protein